MRLESKQKPTPHKHKIQETTHSWRQKPDEGPRGALYIRVAFWGGDGSKKIN